MLLVSLSTPTTPLYHTHVVTQDLEFETLNPKPTIPKPKPKTWNSRPYTLNADELVSAFQEARQQRTYGPDPTQASGSQTKRATPIC